MAGTRVKCSCCGKLVDERTERRHRGLQAPVATLASSPYITAYRERRRLGLHPARVKSRAKRPLVLAPIPETSDEEDGGPPIHPTPPDGLSSDEDEEEVHVDIETAIDDIIRAARVRRQASESDEDVSDSDLDSDMSQMDESEAGNEEMDEVDEDIDIWNIIDEMIIQEAAQGTLETSDHDILRAFTYKVSEHVTRSAFDKLNFVFPSSALPSWKSILSRVVFLSGFKPVLYDSCPNSCILYVAHNADLDECPHCRTSRYTGPGKARAQWPYIPITPRLKSFVADHRIASLMEYRKDHVHEPGRTQDIFDGQEYRRLKATRVEINGEKLSHNHFSDGRDIALGLACDGFSLFKRRSKKSSWPLIALNYNLPPDIRTHREHVIPLGIIPRKPVDIDSWVWPFVEELVRFELGVVAFDALTNEHFRLHTYLVLIFGDIPAISMLMQMKGHNGISPCRMCEIKAVPTIGTKHPTYYVPLDRSNHPDVRADPASIARYDPAALPLRTHQRYMEQAREVQLAPTEAASNRLAKAYGIKGVSVFSCLSSISFPSSFPYGFMHLVWMNLIPNLIDHWTGKFKGLDDGKEDYTLPSKVWDAVGEACAGSKATVPAACGPAPFNVAHDQESWTAESRAFWTQFLGPVILENRFRRPKFYQHFVDLVRILNLCLQFEYSDDDVEAIRTGFINWVDKYEKYYYQFNMNRLSTCMLTIHALLHIAGTIKAWGPIWAYWEFVMERFCNFMKPAIASRRFPVESLHRYMINESMLSHIKIRFNLTEELSLRAPIRDRSQSFPEYKTCCFKAPSVISPRLSAHVTLGIQKCIASRLDLSIDRVKTLFAQATITEWGKMQILPAGDLIQTANLWKNHAGDGRDRTFVRYEKQVDKNERFKNRPVVLIPKTFYGQLRHIFHVKLPASNEFALQRSLNLVIAVLTCCKITRSRTDGLDVHYYKDLGATEFLDIEHVQCMVMRIVAPKNTWAIADRSGALCRAQWDD